MSTRALPTAFFEAGSRDAVMDLRASSTLPCARAARTVLTSGNAWGAGGAVCAVATTAPDTQRHAPIARRILAHVLMRVFGPLMPVLRLARSLAVKCPLFELNAPPH